MAYDLTNPLQPFLMFLPAGRDQEEVVTILLTGLAIFAVVWRILYVIRNIDEKSISSPVTEKTIPNELEGPPEDRIEATPESVPGEAPELDFRYNVLVDDLKPQEVDIPTSTTADSLEEATSRSSVEGALVLRLEPTSISPRPSTVSSPSHVSDLDPNDESEPDAKLAQEVSPPSTAYRKEFVQPQAQRARNQEEHFPFEGVDIDTRSFTDSKESCPTPRIREKYDPPYIVNLPSLQTILAQFIREGQYILIETKSKYDRKCDIKFKGINSSECIKGGNFGIVIKAVQYQNGQQSDCTPVLLKFLSRGISQIDEAVNLANELATPSPDNFVSQYFCSPCEFYPNATNLQDDSFPRMDLMILPWKDDLTLCQYLDDLRLKLNRKERSKSFISKSLQNLENAFVEMSLQLYGMEVIHGDLCGENILVKDTVDDSFIFTLVDIDSLSKGRVMNDRLYVIRGKPQYQSPTRVNTDRSSMDFPPALQTDWVSQLVIAISLRAYRLDLELFCGHGAGSLGEDVMLFSPGTLEVDSDNWRELHAVLSAINDSKLSNWMETLQTLLNELNSNSCLDVAHPLSVTPPKTN